MTTLLLHSLYNNAVPFPLSPTRCCFSSIIPGRNGEECLGDNTCVMVDG